MAADDSNEPGVLGNLPRSRPGQRSAKRTQGAGGAAKRASKPAGPARAQGAKRTPSSVAKPRTSAAGKRQRPATPRASATTSSGSAAPRREPAAARREPQQPGDPLSQAVRLASKVAETGVKTGIGVLRRLSGR
jgi:hypothetical protein